MRNTLIMEEWTLAYIIAVVAFAPMAMIFLLAILYGTAEWIDSFRHLNAAEIRRKAKEAGEAEDAAIT